MNDQQDKSRKGLGASARKASRSVSGSKSSPKTAPGFPPTPSRSTAPADKPDDTCAGTKFGYRVEWRAAGEKPIRTSDGALLYPDWKRVEFSSGAVGVPKQVAKDFGRQLLDFHGLFSYQAAEALRWWLHAEYGDEVATRITKHRIEYDHKIFDEGFIGSHKGAPSTESPTKELKWTWDGDTSAIWMKAISKSEYWMDANEKATQP